MTNRIDGTILFEIQEIRYKALLKKENIMVEVTESASKQIAEYFKDKEVTPIRIFLNAGG